MDRKIAALLINAARTGADTGTNSFPVGGNTLLYGGATTGTTEFNHADWSTEANAAALVEWIGKICQEMDENDVPVNDRCAVVNVPLYYALRRLGLPYSASGTATVSVARPLSFAPPYTIFTAFCPRLRRITAR